MADNYYSRLREAVRTRILAADQNLTNDTPRLDHLIDLYTLVAADRGIYIDRESVHNAWAVWIATTNPDHPDLIPFDQLTPDRQALDERYAAAIRAAIRVMETARV